MNKLSAPLAETRKFRRKSGQEFRGESDRTESREITQTQNRCEEARRQAHRRAPACRRVMKKAAGSRGTLGSLVGFVLEERVGFVSKQTYPHSSMQGG